MSTVVTDINRQRLARDAQSISERVRLFASARCEGHTIVDSYAMAGYSRDHQEASKFHRTHKTEINALMSEELSSYVPQAISTLVKIMKNEDERGAVRLKAAQDILDRAGFGATQKLDVTTSTSDMSTEDLNTQIALLLGGNNVKEIM